jgi:hypothetical protein
MRVSGKRSTRDQRPDFSVALTAAFYVRLVSTRRGYT